MRLFRSHLVNFASLTIPKSKFATLLVLSIASHLQAQDELPDLLYEAVVVDASTGQSIKEFRYLPGVPYSGFSNTDEEPIATWQPHRIKESTTGFLVLPRARSYEKLQIRIEANGYQPAHTEWIEKAAIVGTKRARIELHRDPGIRGQLLTPMGQPAAGAQIAIALPNREVRLQAGTFAHLKQPMPDRLSDQWRRPVSVATSEQGLFEIPTETNRAGVVCFLHETGFLEIPAAELRPSKFTLHAWGDIEGHVNWQGRPGVNEAISLIISHDHHYPALVSQVLDATTDGDGHFEFRNLIPGRVQISRMQVSRDKENRQIQYQFPVVHVNLNAGETKSVVVGGQGTTITGRLTGLDSYHGLSLNLSPRAPHFGRPGDDAIWAGFNELAKSELSTVFWHTEIPVNRDGTFRIEHVIPESYQLFSNSREHVIRSSSVRVLPADQLDADQSGIQNLGEIVISVRPPN